MNSQLQAQCIERVILCYMPCVSSSAHPKKGRMTAIRPQSTT